MKRILVVLVGCLYSCMGMSLTLTSSDFKPNSIIPMTYTCDGRDVSPTLEWSDIPSGTQSFVIILQDPDAPSGVWTHWVIFNIPPTSLVSSDLEGAKLGINSWGEAQYRGPCPPKPTVHRYVFHLYALDSTLNLPVGASAAQVQEAARQHILAKVELIGKYSRRH